MTSDPRPMPNPLPGAPEWSVKSLPRTRSHLPALVLSLFIHHAPRVQLKCDSQDVTQEQSSQAHRDTPVPPPPLLHRHL